MLTFITKYQETIIPDLQTCHNSTDSNLL